ncbi:hypothetical protein K445DRAFT_229155 [Daldinia sp. EC12]|nr:hypothetical protein K445DRAFT_229155 [Daldinia sp. EC12]
MRLLRRFPSWDASSKKLCRCLGATLVKMYSSPIECCDTLQELQKLTWSPKWRAQVYPAVDRFSRHADPNRECAGYYVCTYGRDLCYGSVWACMALLSSAFLRLVKLVKLPRLVRDLLNSSCQLFDRRTDYMCQGLIVDYGQVFTRLAASHRRRRWLLLVQLTYKTVNDHANAFCYLHSAHTPHPSSHDNSTIRRASSRVFLAVKPSR